MAFVQVQRPPLNQTVGASANALRADWVAEQKRDADLNTIVITARQKTNPFDANIPQSEMCLRIAAFNVHMWLNVEELGFATDELLEVVRKIDADIILLNEANGFFDDDAVKEEAKGEEEEASDSSDGSPTTQDSRFARLKEMGFAYSSAKFAPKNMSEFLNVVLSKFPIKTAKYSALPGDENLYGLRIAIDTEFEIPFLGNVFLRLFATHLDVYDKTEETRTKQAEQIVALSQDRLAKNPKELQIILGDFNALRRADYTGDRWRFFVEHDAKRNVVPLHRATDAFEKGGFVDSFALAKVSPPQSTTWSARRVDYMYFGQNFVASDCPLELRGSYVFHDPSSDHIPVICDLGLRANSKPFA